MIIIDKKYRDSDNFIFNHCRGSMCEFNDNVHIVSPCHFPCEQSVYIRGNLIVDCKCLIPKNLMVDGDLNLIYDTESEGRLSIFIEHYLHVGRILRVRGDLKAMSGSIRIIGNTYIDGRAIIARDSVFDKNLYIGKNLVANNRILVKEELNIKDDLILLGGELIVGTNLGWGKLIVGGKQRIDAGKITIKDKEENH